MHDFAHFHRYVWLYSLFDDISFFSLFSVIEPSTEVRLCSTDKPVGILKASLNGYGIALLRVNDVLKQAVTLYTTDSCGNKIDLLTHRPNWWFQGVGVL